MIYGPGTKVRVRENIPLEDVPEKQKYRGMVYTVAYYNRYGDSLYGLRDNPLLWSHAELELPNGMSSKIEEFDEEIRLLRKNNKELKELIVKYDEYFTESEEITELSVDKISETTVTERYVCSAASDPLLRRYRCYRCGSVMEFRKTGGEWWVFCTECYKYRTRQGHACRAAAVVELKQNACYREDFNDHI